MAKLLKKFQEILSDEETTDRIKKMRSVLAKLFPPGRYLNYRIHFPAGYPKMNLGTINVTVLSPTQLFLSDFNVPVMETRGAVEIADTGTGKTNSIFNAVANGLLNSTVIEGPLGNPVKHQVFIVTTPELVLDVTKDLAQIYARDDKEVLASWKARFGIETDGVEAVPFSLADYILTYVQFENMLLGMSNRGRLFWSGKSLKGSPNCKIAVNGIVPTAYHKTPDGYVAGRMPHSIKENAIVRRMTWDIKPPSYTPAPEKKLLNVSQYQSLWLWGGEYPVRIVRNDDEKKRKYFYAGQPEPATKTELFDPAVDGELYDYDRKKLLAGLFKTIDTQFRTVFEGILGYDRLRSIENVTLTKANRKGARLLTIDLTWKARTPERTIQELFGEKGKVLEFTEGLKRTKDFSFINRITITAVASAVEGIGWKLVKTSSGPKYIPIGPDEVEPDFNPCDNITVIIDEAHLLPSPEGREPGSVADFDLIVAAMKDSNMRAFFFSATLTLFPLMSLIQALHPRFSRRDGLHPNLPFLEEYPGITHFQDEPVETLLATYSKYFDFAKSDPNLKKLGIDASFTPLGQKILCNQSAGLLSYHPSLNTQEHYFARSEYGGPTEAGHVIYGVASMKHTRALLQRVSLPWARYRRLINFYNPNDTSLEMPLRFTFGIQEFNLEQFAADVVMGKNEAPYCWYALSLLKLMRERDEQEAATLLDGEKLSRFTIATAIRDSHGVNMIAAILQAAGYQWIRITPKKLDARQRLEADKSWSENKIPPVEYRKVQVLRTEFDTNYDPVLREAYGPSPRRTREGSYKVVTYSTTLIGYSAVALTTVEELADLVIENDYRTPLKGKNGKSLRELEFFRPYNPRARTAVKLPEALEKKRDEWVKFFDSIMGAVIYFWPGSAKAIKNQFQTEIEVVRKANEMWGGVQESFFFRRYLDTTEDRSEFNVRRIELPEFFDPELNIDTESVTDANLLLFIQFFIYDQALDNQGKRELVQTLRELTNEGGETNNEIGVVVLGNKFDTGVDVYGSTTLIATEPYSNWTAEQQKNGRNNRRGGFSEFRYARWVRHQYALALQWPGEQIRAEALATLEKGDKEAGLPTLESLGIELLESEDKAERKSIAGLNRYASAVVTSILRNPITDRRPQEDILQFDTLLQPYQIVRIRAVRNPTVEALNLLGGIAMRVNSVDLAFTEPVVPGEIASPPAKFNGLTIPACIPTKYQLSLRQFQRYVVANKIKLLDPNMKYLLDLYSLSQMPENTVDFLDIMRTNSRRLFVTSNGVSVELPPDLFRTDSSETLLLQLVKEGIACWHTRPAPKVKTKKAPKRLPEEGEQPKKKKQKTVIDLSSIANNFLHFRVQPDTGSIEQNKQLTDAFFRLSEGDLEQASIQRYLHAKAIGIAEKLYRWSTLNAESTSKDAVAVMLAKLTNKLTMTLEHQRYIQHALSIMQYYGMLDWNLSMVLLTGIYLSIAKKNVQEDITNAALLAAHCYRAAFTNVTILDNLWDLDIANVTIEETIAFLSLLSSWEVGNPEEVQLSSHYAQLRDDRDEVLCKIFSELYENFYFSIQKNLPVFAKILSIESSHATTSKILNRVVAVSKTPIVFAHGIQEKVMRKILRHMVEPQHSMQPYAYVIAEHLPSKSLVVRVAKLLELELPVFVKQIISSATIGEFITQIWPMIQEPPNDSLRDLVQFYGQASVMKEDLEARFTNKKPPKSLELLLKKLKGVVSTEFLPFHSSIQRGKTPKASRIRYKLSQPGDLQSSVIEVTRGDLDGGHDTGHSIVHLILDDHVVYFRRLNYEWNLKQLYDELIPAVIQGREASDELVEIISNNFPNVIEGKTFSEARAYISELCFNSGLFDEDSRLAEQLRDRFLIWLQQNVTFSKEVPGVSDIQNKIIDLWLSVPPAQVYDFRDFLLQIAPQARFHWELFRLAKNNIASDGPDTESIGEIIFKVTYLEELLGRFVEEREINKAQVEKFSEKVRILQRLAPTYNVGEICQLLVDSYKRLGKKQPGVAIYLRAMKLIAKEIEAEFYSLEGAQPPAPTPKVPKRVAPEPVLPSSQPEEEIVILDDEPEEVENEPKKQKPDEEEEEEQEPSFGLDALCSVCFAETIDCECETIE